MGSAEVEPHLTSGARPTCPYRYSDQPVVIACWRSKGIAELCFVRLVAVVAVEVEKGLEHIVAVEECSAGCDAREKVEDKGAGKRCSAAMNGIWRFLARKQRTAHPACLGCPLVAIRSQETCRH